MTHQASDRDAGYRPEVQKMPRTMHRALVVLWVLAWLAGVAATATDLVDETVNPDVDVPRWVALVGAAQVCVLHAVALAHRAGPTVLLRTGAWSLLVAVLAGGGLWWAEPWALSGVAVLCAVLSAVTAVLVTRRASTAMRASVELGVSVAVALAGAVAVAAIDAPVRPQRYELVVTAASLVLIIAVVWRLGSPVHGLGRRGLLLVVAFAAVVTALAVYVELLDAYGPAALLDPVRDASGWVAERLGGVPRPVEALVGFPLLVWGVYARARRRRGWWICAFAVLGTAAVTTTLAGPLDPEYAAVSLAYALAVGLVLGLAVRQVDRAWVGSAAPGRRAGRSGAAQALPPEPPRTDPLR